MSIWQKQADLEALNANTRRGLVEKLGISFTAVGDNSLTATMPVDASNHQPFGLLHGGASVALAETVASSAGYLAVGDDQGVVGLEINANHVRGVRSGQVTATATPQHLGATTQVWNIEIVNDKGQLVCTSRMTAAVIKGV